MQFKVVATGDQGNEVTLYEGPDSHAATGVVEGILGLAGGGSFSLSITADASPPQPAQAQPPQRQPRPGTTQQR